MPTLRVANMRRRLPVVAMRPTYAKIAHRCIIAFWLSAILLFILLHTFGVLDPVWDFLSGVPHRRSH